MISYSYTNTCMGMLLLIRLSHQSRTCVPGEKESANHTFLQIKLMKRDSNKCKKVAFGVTVTDCKNSTISTTSLSPYDMESVDIILTGKRYSTKILQTVTRMQVLLLGDIEENCEIKSVYVHNGKQRISVDSCYSDRKTKCPILDARQRSLTYDINCLHDKDACNGSFIFKCQVTPQQQSCIDKDPGTTARSTSVFVPETTRPTPPKPSSSRFVPKTVSPTTPNPVTSRIVPKKCDGKYGHRCMYPCHCLDTGCDPITGTCPQGKCEHGYMSNQTGHLNCQLKICEEPGKYGDECDKVCHCKNNTSCVQKTGRCIYGCAKNRRGKHCDLVPSSSILWTTGKKGALAGGLCAFFVLISLIVILAVYKRSERHLTNHSHDNNEKPFLKSKKCMKKSSKLTSNQEIEKNLEIANINKHRLEDNVYPDETAYTEY